MKISGNPNIDTLKTNKNEKSKHNLKLAGKAMPPILQQLHIQNATSRKVG